MDVSHFKITSKEDMILRTIKNTGFYLESYNDALKISSKILTNCIKKGLVRSERSVMIFTKLHKAYSLTDYGKDFIKKIYMSYPYTTNIRNVEHDYILGKVYLSLSIEERKTWVTEDSLLFKHQGIPVVDGVFTDFKGRIVGVEIITDNYSKDDILGKKSFVSRFCDKGIFINTKDIV